jgi:hypothetical protein
VNKITWQGILVGFVIGSFFGISQLLALFGGVTGAVKGGTVGSQ